MTNPAARWAEDRAETRDLHLAAVRVSGQHQIKLTVLGPAQLIGRVAEQNSQRPLLRASAGNACVSMSGAGGYHGISVPANKISRSRVRTVWQRLPSPTMPAEFKVDRISNSSLMRFSWLPST